MEFYQLQYLKAVVAHKSYSKAANSLFITQPAISIAIKKLEKEFQITLLERRDNAVVLTEDGMKVYPACMRALRDYERIQTAVESCKAPAKHTLRLLVPYFLNEKVNLINKTILSAEQSNVHITVDQTGINPAANAFEQGDYDLYIISSASLPMVPAHMSEQIRDYATVEYFAYFLKSHPFARLDAVPSEQLSREKLLVSKGNTGISGIVSNYFGRQGLDFIPDTHNYPPPVLLNFVNHRLGIGIMPMMENIPAEVTCRPLDPPLEDELKFVWSEEAAENGHVFDIMDHLGRIPLNSGLQEQLISAETP